MLTVAPFGSLGPVQQAGNTLLGILWLVTGIAGYRAARQRRFADHRLWMLRSVALTWSIVANRAWLLISFAIFAPGVYGNGPVEPAQIAQAVGVAVWASWVVNLLAVEWWVVRRRPTVAAQR